jgi:hypothetical protein
MSVVILIVLLLVCMAAVLAPFLIDWHHWWPRKRK